MTSQFRLITAASITAVALAALLGLPTLVQAQTTTLTADLAVTTTVAKKCTISTLPLVFAAYDPITGTAVDGTGSVVIACSKGSTTAIGLTLGTNGSVTQRRMIILGTPVEYLNYSLSSTLGGSEWTLTNPLSYVATSKAQSTLTVYGRVAANQDATVGSYSDTVTATITF